MKHRLFRTTLLAIVALLLPYCLSAQNNKSPRDYTTEKPLIYEDAWNLWPYCFLNEHGEPEGYNIDLVRMICEELNIPYVIKLKPTRDALADLKAGRSDLMLGLDNRYERTDLICSKIAVQLFTHSVLHPKGKEPFIKTLNDLGRQTVIVHQGSLSHHLMEQNGWAGNAIPMKDMKAAVRKVSAEGKGQIVWNTMSLKWLMRKYQIDNLQLSSVDMPHGAYKFMSTDSVLLIRLEDAFKRLSMSTHNFESLQNRWFYPDRVDSGIPSWLWYVTGGTALFALILLFLNFFYRYSERQMTLLVTKNSRHLAHILNLSHMFVWTYDVSARTFTWLDTESQKERTFTALEFGRQCSHTDFEQLCEALRQVGSKEEQQLTIEIKARDARKAGKELREYSVNLSVLRWENEQPAIILGTMSDVTAERERMRKTTSLIMRYKSIFETAMVDMIYFDENGYIRNMNQRAQRTFHMTKEKAQEMHINVSALFDDKDFSLDNFSHYHVTRSMQVYNMFLPEEEEKHDSNIYYELQLVPLRDKNKRLMGIYGTGFEVTDFINNWRRKKENIRQMKEANQEVGIYIKNIDYALKVGGVRMITYSPTTHTMTVYSETNVVQYTLTQARCVALVAESSKRKALRLLDHLDSLTQQPIDTVILTNLRTKGLPLYLQVNLIPVLNAKGTAVESYFGMVRDLSEIKSSEQQLAMETQRAREVEELKNSFLRNMSYEIRTPLNAVVGFAELFEMAHTLADEEIFIREIKDNAAHLLQLINDILFLSRLDAHMIEIAPQPIDFAKTFESHCFMGWNNFRKERVHYSVLNHFEQLEVNIDDANLGLVIEQIVANAAQHTDRGTVRARYDYFDGKLMITVEDTGRGIPQEKMGHIFERFNSGGKGGTGLGLPICQELTKQMGGYLDINSTEGKGTIVWIVIPCELISLERRIEDYKS